MDGKDGVEHSQSNAFHQFGFCFVGKGELHRSVNGFVVDLYI